MTTDGVKPSVSLLRQASCLFLGPLSLPLSVSLSVCACVYTGVTMLWCTRGRQRTTFRSRFSLSTAGFKDPSQVIRILKEEPLPVEPSCQPSGFFLGHGLF